MIKLRVVQISLLLIFTGVGFVATVWLPYSTGSDEAAHFYFTRFIARYHRLPTTPEEQAQANYKSDLPPLFYILAGMSGSGLDLNSPPFLKVTGDNPRLQLVIGDKEATALRALNTEDPLQGEVLLWYIGRWVTLLGGVISLIIVHQLLAINWPAQAWLALSGVVLLAFIPTYLRTSSVISYEPLLGVWLGGYFLLLFQTLCRPNRHWPYFGLGLLLGLACTTKYTPLPIILFLPVFVLWLGRANQWTLITTLGRLSLTGLGVLVTFGSWVIFTLIHFNQVTKQGWFIGLIEPFLASDSSDETSLRLVNLLSEGTHGLASTDYDDTIFQWAWRLFNSVWGHGWLAWVFLPICLAAAIGLIRQWRQYNLATQHWLTLLLVHFSLLLSLPFVRFVMTNQATTASGQHILLPAGAVILLLLIYGLRAWLSPARLAGLFGLLAVLVLWQDIYTLQQSKFVPWPIQTTPLQNEPTVAAFEGLSLIGYQLHPGDQTLTVVLQWRAESFLNEDYRLELRLFDQGVQPQTHWLGQPLNGRFPTRAWFPNDRVRTEIQLPIAGLPAGIYQVNLRLLGETEPLKPNISHAPDGRLELGQVQLNPAPFIPARRISFNGHEIGYTLWQVQPVYQERAAILVSVSGEEVSPLLIGPTEQTYAPVAQTGSLYNFYVEPRFARGEYRLQFELPGDLEVTTEPVFRVETQPRQFEVGAMSRRVEANFAGQVALLGYDLPQRNVEPGGELPITLHWQALRNIGADLIFFSHLVDQDDQIWGEQNRLANDVYSTLLWAPHEIVSDSFAVAVDPATPNGIYYLLVGLYLPVGQGVSLPLLEEGQFTEVTHVNLGAIKVGQTPASFVRQSANPLHILNQPFGQGAELTLLGYDLHYPSKEVCQLGCELSLSLYWQVGSPLSSDYTTFVHVRNEADEIIAQKDQPPLGGAYPTSLWGVGEIIADEISLPLSANLAGGRYRIVVGLYDFQTGQRLAVPNQPDNSVTLDYVEVK
jgi:hypothetical protein